VHTWAGVHSKPQQAENLERAWEEGLRVPWSMNMRSQCMGATRHIKS
jgi:hypothetical protein